jgi:hypothetical protein
MLPAFFNWFNKYCHPMHATKELSVSAGAAGFSEADVAIDAGLNVLIEADGEGAEVCAAERLHVAGIHFVEDGDGGAENKFLARLDALQLLRYVSAPIAGKGRKKFVLGSQFINWLMPQGDTMQLSRNFRLDPVASSTDLEREIILAMLAAPQALEFPTYEEFHSAVRIRCNIVTAARRTQLAFHTSQAERPADYWKYTAGRGFTVLPGKSLIAALQKATQPENADGNLYSFSCYRATEYVILLSMAQELELVNPLLLAQLQSQWEQRAIMSGEFHDVFLHEFGSADQPLPPRYYIPGDRVWFRNPDEHSSDASGYEGSWVFYLGGGFFSNFWKRDQPYTFNEKCVEIFHWRHATYLDEDDELRIDESIVESDVRQTLGAPGKLDGVLREMAQLRDRKGVYAGGGCVDLSREFPRYVCPGTAAIQLPDR